MDEPDIDQHTAYNVDGMAFLQAMDESRFDTFDDFVFVVMQRILTLLAGNNGEISVTLVFHRYDLGYPLIRWKENVVQVVKRSCLCDQWTM